MTSEDYLQIVGGVCLRDHYHCLNALSNLAASIARWLARSACDREVVSSNPATGGEVCSWARHIMPLPHSTQV